MKSKDWLTPTLIIVILVQLALQLKQCSNKVDPYQVIAALQDTLTTVRDENGVLTGTIRTITTENTDQFLAIQTKDSVIQSLKDEVARRKKWLKDGGTVAVITTTTDINTVDTGVTTTGKDTIKVDNTIYIFPQYHKMITNYGKWITGEITIDKDTCILDLHIEHDYSVVIGKQDGTPYAEITSKNPFDNVTAFRTYQVTIPKTNLLPTFLIGVGVGFVGGILIPK